MKYSVLQYLFFALFAYGLFSCSSTKYIPDGEYLLDKVHIKSDIREYGTMELKPYIRQIPNYQMFAINKTQLQIYNLSGRDSSRWLNRQLKKIGEPPVILDSTLVWKTTSELSKFFFNKGYMNVQVIPEIKKNEKKAEVTYQIKANKPYRINEYGVDIQDSMIYEELYGNDNTPQKLTGEQATARNTLIKKNMLFDRDILDKERERITGLLRNRGYYAFEKDFISYEADSIQNQLINLKLQLHPYPEILPSGTFAEVPHRKHYFNNIFIHLDYDPLKTATGTNYYQATDSVVKNGYTIYYKGNSPSIRPSVLINNSFLTPTRPYAQIREELTYSSYASLQALSNTSIQYEEFVRNDSALLNCHILTIPAKKQSVTYSIEGTNTAGDLGVASSMNYSHRNLFKSSETFNFKIRGAYEAITRNEGDYSPYLELGTEASIQLPKFMFPLLSNSFKRRMHTTTEFSLSYNYQTRPEYDRTLLSGGVRYIWQGRGNHVSRHQFDLLDVNYVLIPRIDSIFEVKLPENAKAFSYTSQFIVGLGYSYSHSTFDPYNKRRNVHTLRTSVESAGNVLYAANSLFNSGKDNKGSYELLGIYYAQFLKGDIDYSKTISIDKNNSIAWRTGGGIGVPYGNSRALPFEKRYYSGGANSVRAWSVRELGPGSYHPNDTTTFFVNQSGDIKLDLNIEYRSRFFWKLEAAAFIDAGNIWTIRNYEGQEGGLFKLNTFYKQIAVGYGLGIRLDYDFFLVRFDCGWKAYNPEKDGKEKWAILQPNFRNNWAWHIAVGYPF